MMTTEPLGLYLHIPFCLQKCLYCDFYSLAGRAKDEKDRYTAALCTEIASYQRATKLPVDTVFFGGGTPTLLGAASLIQILTAVRCAFDLSPTAEISIEMNPATASEKMLFDLRTAGFNRLSIGAQSLCDRELQQLGRVHSAKDFADSFRIARKAGFDNINVDLMYAIPQQSQKSFFNSVEGVLSLSPEHISVYSLIIEENTPFYEKHKNRVLLSEEKEYDWYRKCLSLLCKADYTHYEISNYAKKGRECRHNLKYWTLSPYIGCGPAAHSFIENKRYENEKDFDAYLNSPFSLRKTEELPDGEALAYEYAMLGLRTRQGIDCRRYEALCRHPFAQGKETFLAQCQKAGYLHCEGERVALTDSGMYVSLAILAELI